MIICEYLKAPQDNHFRINMLLSAYQYVSYASNIYKDKNNKIRH